MGIAQHKRKGQGTRLVVIQRTDTDVDGDTTPSTNTTRNTRDSYVIYDLSLWKSLQICNVCYSLD